MASYRIYTGATPMMAIIVDPKAGWAFQEDRRGRVTHRNIIAAVVYKFRDGTCWIETARYTQEHRGESNWGDVRYSEPVEEFYDYEVPCYTVD